MNAYVDANALVRHYLDVEKRQKLLAMLTGPKSSDACSVPVTELLQFEVKNAIERMVFETRTGGTAHGLSAIRHFAVNLAGILRRSTTHMCQEHAKPHVLLHRLRIPTYKPAVRLITNSERIPKFRSNRF